MLYITIPLKNIWKMLMKLENIHEVLEFNQSDWLKIYIDFNTVLRTREKNDFEKRLFQAYE